MGFISSDGSEHDSSYDQMHHERNVYGRNDDGGDLGLAKAALNAPVNFMKGLANKVAEEQARAAAMRESAKNTGIMVDFYCAGNWDGVLNVPTPFHSKGIALNAIAHAKKGNYEFAFKQYLSYIDYGDPDSGVEEYFSEKTKKFFAETSLSSLAEEAIKQAYSKAKGHQVTDDEFKQFQISFYEKKITNLYAGLNTGKGKGKVQRYFFDYTVYAFNGRYSENIMPYWIRKWCNLQGVMSTEYTGEDLKKIPGINEEMIKDLLFLHEVYAIKSGKKKAGVGGKIGCFLALAAIVVIAVVIAALVL
jgi:uncharacterized protein with GYD domain